MVHKWLRCAEDTSSEGEVAQDSQLAGHVVSIGSRIHDKDVDGDQSWIKDAHWLNVKGSEVAAGAEPSGSCELAMSSQFR